MTLSRVDASALFPSAPCGDTSPSWMTTSPTHFHLTSVWRYGS
ncbi:hypothetical protein HMPREF9596_00479 [Cutibacterium acnes HL005PA3]|nr:hypothetical protein HMPREF9596_00479 [Cutibacterium acnes HL005PA3]